MKNKTLDNRLRMADLSNRIEVSPNALDALAEHLSATPQEVKRKIEAGVLELDKDEAATIVVRDALKD